MAVVHVSCYTDPACPLSWAAEPWLRRLTYEFGDDLDFTYVMSGFARTIDRPLDQLSAWLDASAASGMPLDPRLWLDAPPASSYPAAMAVKAATEQGLAAPLLRVLREGFAVRRRKLDTSEALVDAARSVAGLDVDRFRIDLGSHAIVEAFGADLDRAQALQAPGARRGGDGRVAEPWLEFHGPGGELHGVAAGAGIEAIRGAALAAGATATAAAQGPLGVEEALRRFGSLAAAEVAAVCELPGPRAEAELWRLAVEWRLRPERFVAGALWSAA